MTQIVSTNTSDIIVQPRQYLYIVRGVVVDGTLNAVLASDDSFVTNDGTIASFRAVRLDSTAVLVNMADGMIYGDDLALETTGGASGVIDNRGTMFGQNSGILAFQASAITINNSGVIEAGYGIFDDTNPADNINAAIMSASDSSLTINNSGTIKTDRSDGFAVRGQDAIDVITNTGMMIGVVSLGGANDRIDTRSGKVVGLIDLGAGNDTAYGSAGADSINAGSENDLVRGGGGRDILDGGAGIDTLDNSDRTQKVQVSLNGANVATVYVNNLAEDTVRNFEHVYGGSAGDVIVGDGLSNLVVGNAGNDSISAGSGNDTVKGGVGADVMDGGANTDTLDYTDKTLGITLTLTGGTAATVKVGAANEDSVKNFENVLGGSGADHIVGDGLANTIRGGVGKDVLDGGAGIDTADYSDKTQKVTVTLNGATAVSVFINGTAAANAEDSIKNFENLTGGSAGDKLTGDGLANLLVGGLGNDSLSGAGGNDILIGGAGNDSLTGGAGTDHFRFAFNIDLLNGVDTITDFVHGSDRIEFDTPGTTTPVQVGTAFLGESNFVPSNSTALFIYDYSSGVLYYDLVPGIAGGEIPFAVLQNHAVIDATDLWFV